jgi:hypothetical protein
MLGPLLVPHSIRNLATSGSRVSAQLSILGWTATWTSPSHQALRSAAQSIRQKRLEANATSQVVDVTPSSPPSIQHLRRFISIVNFTLPTPHSAAASRLSCAGCGIGRQADTAAALGPKAGLFRNISTRLGPVRPRLRRLASPAVSSTGCTRSWVTIAFRSPGFSGGQPGPGPQTHTAGHCRSSMKMLNAAHQDIASLPCFEGFGNSSALSVIVRHHPDELPTPHLI